MTPKRGTAAVAAALFGLMLAAAGEKPDADKLVGTWQVIAGERQGKEIEGREKELLTLMQLTFTPDKATIGPVGQAYTYTLDPAKKPGQLTLTRDDKSETLQGIYAFEGELLRLCISSAKGADARPTAFATKESTQSTLLVLSRVGARPGAEGEAGLSEAAHRARSGQNLRFLAIAMHNRHSDFNRFPGAAVGSLGQKGKLSWRVELLPYLEQDALYKEFKTDEPWDSEHNKKLIARMPKLYALPGKKAEPGQTHYRVFVGKGTMFESPDGQRLADVNDGSSSTILIVEAAESVVWTRPDELAYLPDKPLPKLGGHFKEGDVFHAVFADGAVRPIRQDAEEKLLRPFLTRNGGETVDLKVLAPK